jgi:hypothetical protein
VKHHADGSPSTEGIPLDLPGASWPDWRWLAMLLVLVAGLRAWQLTHTEVASRDCIGYIRYTSRLEHEPWPKVMRDSKYHPGYPIAVLLVSNGVRALVPDDVPWAMQISAQLVSCIASLLLVIPMYYLGRELFDRRVGFWAALLFQCLPASGRVLGDGLSDPLFLLFAATTALLAMIALRTGKPGWFVLAGLSGGMAYLIRAEGILLPVMTGVVLLAIQASRPWRRSWRQIGINSAGLASVLFLAAPFMFLIGGLTSKPSATHMKDSLENISPLHLGASDRPELVLPRLPLAIWWIGADVRPQDRYFWAAKAVLIETDRALFHILTVPAFLGLWLFRRRFADVPGAWVLLATGTLLTFLLYWLGVSNGYVGERHVLLIVMVSLYFAVAALASLSGWLARAISRWRPGLAGNAISLTVLVLLTTVPLSKTLARLHVDRHGFKQAGLWLAKNADPGEEIIDPFAWSAYYAGRSFRAPGEPVPVRPAWCYVVLERSRNDHQHLRFLLDDLEKLVEGQIPVMSFPMGRRRFPGKVEVYRIRVTAKDRVPRVASSSPVHHFLFSSSLTYSSTSSGCFAGLTFV